MSLTDPSPPDQLEHRLPFDRTAGPAARRLVDEFLSQHDATPARAQDVVIVVGELIANALDHGRPVEGHLELALERRDDAVQISVRDAGGNGVPRVQTVSVYAERGRGLAMVQAMAREWWCTHDRGTTVVAVLPLS